MRSPYGQHSSPHGSQRRFPASGSAKSASSTSDVYAKDGTRLSQAEQIRYKYMSQSALQKHLSEEGTRHRRYSAAGITTHSFHSLSPRTSANSFASSSSMPFNSFTTSPKQSRSRVHPLSSAKLQAIEPGSPSKHSISPIVAASLANFDILTITEYVEGQLPPPRSRTKSLSSSERSGPPISAKSSGAAPLVPAILTSDFRLSAKTSTAELVKLYEQRATKSMPLQAVSRSGSPVKEWLRQLKEPETPFEKLAMNDGQANEAVLDMRTSSLLSAQRVLSSPPSSNQGILKSKDFATLSNHHSGASSLDDSQVSRCVLASTYLTGLHRSSIMASYTGLIAPASLGQHSGRSAERFLRQEMRYESAGQVPRRGVRTNEISI